MREYNKLTKSLLAAGYTAEHYPDYVRIPNSRYDKADPLHNLQDGFEYVPEYRNKLVFKTGCGLLVKGSRFTGSMGYMGITWIPENDNPVIACPYRKDSCGLRNPILGGPIGGGPSKLFQCDCHQTAEPYIYEKSIDRVRDDYEKFKKKKYDEFSEKAKGHVCQWHMYWSDWEEKWSQHYDPIKCARCCLNIGRECDLTHELLSKKKGNVFYDVKMSHIRHDGTLFDGQEIVKINKGVRLFDTAKSITICEQAVKMCAKYIRDRERHRHWGWKVEIMNIRAERREIRDLMQDLQDISEGIEVIHESDLKKADKTAKKERRQQAQEKKIAKLEKKILEVGYDNLEEYSLDRIHADKWLGEERIAELEQERQKRIRQKENEPVQMSLFDLGVMP